MWKWITPFIVLFSLISRFSCKTACRKRLTHCWKSPLDQRNQQMALNGLACWHWMQRCGLPFLKLATDVRWFLFRVRVGTEANQMTVNKWAPCFYWGKRKPGCHSISVCWPTLPHTHKHTRASIKSWGRDWRRSHLQENQCGLRLWFPCR